MHRKPQLCPEVLLLESDFKLLVFRAHSMKLKDDFSSQKTLLPRCVTPGALHFPGTPILLHNLLLQLEILIDRCLFLLCHHFFHVLLNCSYWISIFPRVIISNYTSVFIDYMAQEPLFQETFLAPASSPQLSPMCHLHAPIVHAT